MTHEPFSDDEICALDLNRLAWQAPEEEVEETLHRLVATFDYWYERTHKAEGNRTWVDYHLEDFESTHTCQRAEGEGHTMMEADARAFLEAWGVLAAESTRDSAGWHLV